MQQSDDASYLPTVYQNFIYKSRYSKWLPDKGRRENWPETVDRYIHYMFDHLSLNQNFYLPQDTIDELRNAILNQDIMPSMRLLMTAGKACERENIAAYNCSYMPIDSLRSFDESMYIAMNGCGIGFSVEKKYVDKLPTISESFYESNTTIVVEDNRAGWAGAFRELIAMLWSGQIPKWDTSKLRKAGEKLVTFGGRSSGPEPLEELFRFTVELIRNAAGRKLTTIECHDLMCKIGEIVVVGGVRRTALISYSDLDDNSMALAKSGQWWESSPHRRLANNTAVYQQKPTMELFMQEWHNIFNSKSGERGIFNLDSVKSKFSEIGREFNTDIHANPCQEIFLNPYQFCNLSNVIVRDNDTEESLAKKVELATILGTYQASLTNFKYLRKVWKKTTEKEALLGVGLCGALSNKLVYKDSAALLLRLRSLAKDVNIVWANKFGINPAAGITCDKPDGNSSQKVYASPGINAWHNDYFLRSVRIDKNDPIGRLMKDYDFPCEDDVMDRDHTWVFSFPQKAPDGALLRKDLTAIQHLEIWLNFRNNWCDHNPSVTINVKDHEWLGVGDWVYTHFDELGGVSFLPYSDHVYKQAPYQDLTKEEYDELIKKIPTTIRWDDLIFYENEDNTVGSQTLACSADGGCETIDLV